MACLFKFTQHSGLSDASIAHLELAHVVNDLHEEGGLIGLVLTGYEVAQRRVPAATRTSGAEGPVSTPPSIIIQIVSSAFVAAKCLHQ